MRPAALALTLAGGLAYVLGSLLWLRLDQRRDTVTFPAGSIHDTSPEGCALAFRYLRETSERGPQAVKALTRPIAAARPETTAVVFRLHPRPGPGRTGEGSADEEQPSIKRPRGKPRTAARAANAKLLDAEEERWVRGGGRLILGLDADYGPLALSTDRTDPRSAAPAPLTKAFPLWPDVRRLEPPRPRAVTRGAPEAAHALFILGQRAAILRWRLGQGDVFLLATPEILSNAHLPRLDHLRLLHALAGSARQVYFDEHALGLGDNDGLLELMLSWGLGPSLVLAATGFVLLLWRQRVRLGPPEEDRLPPRADAVDLVESMAQLYDRVLTRREVAERYLASFERFVALRTGLAGRALSGRVRELLDGSPPRLPPGRELGPADLARFLTQVNTGHRRLLEHAHSGRRR